MRKRKLTVNEKTATGIIIFAVILSVLIGVAGSLIFDRAIQKQYNDRGYVVANMILHAIDHDRIARYVETWEEDEYYPQMEAYLRAVEDYSNAAYIYIAVPYEDRTMRYVYDSDTFMGDTDPIAADFDEVWNAYINGERPESYLTRNSPKYGALTSSCLPVKDSSGKVVALLFVDTHMEVILSTLYKYICNMIIISVILLIAYCMINFRLLNKNFIGPITVIMKNVSTFVQNNAHSDGMLETIKTGDEMEDLAREIDKMENDIVKYIDNIQAITAERERLGAEMDVAIRIQEDMLPGKFPPFPDRPEFDIYATMNPARGVGGDFYDFYLVDDDHLALVLSDVAGKGIPAALFMVMTKTLIKNRAYLSIYHSTAEILRDVNRQLCEGNDSEMFATVWLCILEISTGKCKISNAGHEHPALRRKDGQFELVKYKHSMAVGTFPTVGFEEHEFRMQPGDTLFIYTDGVPEATKSDDELFGTRRMLEALNKEPDADAEKLLANVKESIDEFVGEAPQFDDITMLGFRYLGNK